MNVLLIAQYYYPESEKKLIVNCNGNISAAHHKLVNNLYKGLEQNGCKVELLTTIPAGNFPRKCNCLSFPTTYRSKGYEIGYINLPILKHMSRKISVKKYVKKWLKDKENSENLILIYDLYLPFFSALISTEKRYNVKIIPIIPDIPGPLCVEFKTYNYITKKYKTFQYEKIKKKLKKIDASIVLTKYMTEVLEIEKKKSIVIEGMVDSQLDLKNVKRASDENINILYAGELSKVVGVDLLLETFSMFGEDEPFKLHICGKGSTEEDIKKLKKRNVIYHGFLDREKMNELEKQIDIYVNPRTNSGEFTKYSFPSKNLEYLKTGKPVIAFKLDGIPDEYDEYLNYPYSETAESLKEKIVEISKRDSKVYADNMKKQLAFVEEKTVFNQGKRICAFLEDVENENIDKED